MAEGVDVYTIIFAIKKRHNLGRGKLKGESEKGRRRRRKRWWWWRQREEIRT